MISSCTFIPSQRVKDLLCMLWAEYGCCGETRQILIDLRAELGPVEFALFEKDLKRLMINHQLSALKAMGKIIQAAIRRSPHTFKTTQLRGIYQPEQPGD